MQVIQSFVGSSGNYSELAGFYGDDRSSFHTQ